MESDQRRVIRTMCPMNCHPTLCGMLATVEAGRLVEVRGDKANPDSQGFLCVRGHAAGPISSPSTCVRPKQLPNRMRGSSSALGRIPPWLWP